MRVLVTGAGGMLGSAFWDALAGHEVQGIGRGSLDVRDPSPFLAAMEVSPHLVINCAAHTDVESAEREAGPALNANVMLPAMLGSACRRAGAILVHVSSSGCYGDWKPDPYNEEDVPRPASVHHRSKLSGEQAVRQSGCDHLILRTGWLFGGSPGQPKNFVWRRLIEARATARITSDAVQRGNPTYVGDVARQALALIESQQRGTFNVVSNGTASRFDYVSRIVECANLSCRVEPGPAFRRLAPVSANEAALNTRLDMIGLNLMPSWQDAVAAHVAELIETPEWRRDPA